MERNYRLASMLGGVAGIVAVVFLATLALAGPRLGEIFAGGGYLQPHNTSGLAIGDDPLSDPHGGGGCKGPCDATPVNSSGDSSGDPTPKFDNPAGTLPVLSSGDDDLGRHGFQEASAEPFNPSLSMGGGGSGKGSGIPPIFTGGGGGPPPFLGKPPSTSGGEPPPGGGGPPGDPGGGTTPPGGGSGPPSVDPPPAVPEPAAWALFVIGVGAIGAALRATRPR